MTLWRLYLVVFLSASFIYRLTRLIVSIRTARRQGRGRTTARPIFWVMTASYLLFLAFGAWEALRRAEPYAWSLSILGFLLYVSALLLRERAMRDLGRYFSPDIEIRSGHRVVRQGFYSWVRHPLLVCLMVEVAGLGLCLNAVWTLLFLGVGFYLPVILIRKRLEEKTLLEQLGEDYRLYQQEVGAFVPKWHIVSGLRTGFRH